MEKAEGTSADQAMSIDPLPSTSQRTLDDPVINNTLPAGHGRIIRDSEGNVIGIELPEETDDQGNEKDEPVGMDALEPQVEPDTLHKWVSRIGSNNQQEESATKNSTNVVKGESPQVKASFSVS